MFTGFKYHRSISDTLLTIFVFFLFHFRIPSADYSVIFISTVVREINKIIDNAEEEQEK